MLDSYIFRTVRQNLLTDLRFLLEKVSKTSINMLKVQCQWILFGMTQIL